MQIVVDAEVAVARAPEPVLEDALRALVRYGVSEGISTTVRSSRTALVRLGVDLTSEAEFRD